MLDELSWWIKLDQPNTCNPDAGLYSWSTCDAPVCKLHILHRHNSAVAFLFSASIVRVFFSFDTNNNSLLTIIGLYLTKKNLFKCLICSDWSFASKLTIFQSCGDIFLAGTSTKTEKGPSTTLRPWWDSNPRPCDQGFGTLPTELTVPFKICRWYT